MKDTRTCDEWMLVRSDVLPEIYGKVLHMKNELAESEAASVSEAARRYGISRSAYYKYKDAVRSYVDTDDAAVMTVRVLLEDRPGVLSGLLSAFAGVGVNVLTVNQQPPAGGSAQVTLCVRTDRMALPPDLFAAQIGDIAGVQRLIGIQQEGTIQ